MVRITFNLDDPEGTRQVEPVGLRQRTSGRTVRFCWMVFEDWIKGVSA